MKKQFREMGLIILYLLNRMLLLTNYKSILFTEVAILKCSCEMCKGESILDVELNGSTAGYIALAAKARESTVIASKWPNILA